MAKQRGLHNMGDEGGTDDSQIQPGSQEDGQAAQAQEEAGDVWWRGGLFANLRFTFTFFGTVATLCTDSEPP